MAKSYMKATFTLPAGSSVNLLAQLIAEGFDGGGLAKYLLIHPKALTDVFYGSASTVSATTGIPILTTSVLVRAAGHNSVTIDLSSFWLFSTAGGDISVHIEAS